MNALAPLAVATDWGAAGVAPLGMLLAAVAATAFFYLRVLRREPPPLGALLLLSAAGLAVAWCSPVLFSSDVYAYAAYGEMARLGMNPYAHPPAGLGDAIVRAAQLQWIGAFPICVYGPAFVGFASAVVVAFAPFGFLAQLDAFRVAACASFLLCGALAYRCYPGDRASRLRAAATLALNPVAIWTAAEGHNDAIALAAVLAGFAIAKDRVALGAAIVALSASIKAPGAAAAIAFSTVNARARIGAALGVGMAAAASIPLLTALFGDVAPHGQYAPQASLQAIAAPLGVPWAVAAAALVAIIIAARGITLLRAATLEGWIWLGIAAWTLVPNPYPWYALWLLALAALMPRSRGGTVAIALSFTSLLRYVPDAVGMPAGPLSVALGVAAAAPLVALIPLRAVREYNERLV